VQNLVAGVLITRKLKYFLAYSRTQIWIFGAFDPKMGAVSTRHPEGTKIYTIQAIAKKADKLLFRKMMSANRYIHFVVAICQIYQVLP